MTLAPGTRIGPYELDAQIGAGGMGEVYRARDPRLERDVAIKVLPADFARDPDRLRRFQQEARAAGALNHPHIMGVYDLGEHQGFPYLVCELLEGESLAQRLRSGPLPPRRAAELAAEVARGLAAAHDRGLVHRDLKPDNIYILKGGSAKILDFGLAKLRGGAAGENEPTRSILGPDTAEGVILGTVGYMSPEQVRGEAADARSDLFSLGVVLFEMLTGERPFRGATGVEVLNAILKEDPPDLRSSARAIIPPALERIVRHAMEKEPDRRFQNARDFAFDLENLSQDSGAQPVPDTPKRQLRLPLVAGALTLLVAGGLGGVWAGSRRSEAPTFKRLTFGKGNVVSARFNPGSAEVLYSARWGGQDPEVFAVHPDNLQPRALGIGNAELLAVSPTQELAVSLKPRLWNAAHIGALARVVPGGGGLREVALDVQEADWLPGGTDLALIRATGTGLSRVVEFPVGHPIHTSVLQLGELRVSPDGTRAAAVEFVAPGDPEEIVTLDRSGHRQVLARTKAFSGLAWGPGGKELWFGESGNDGSSIWALSPDGSRRLLLRQAGQLILQDVAPDGRALITLGQTITGVMTLQPPDYRERDLSWNEATRATDFTPDGRQLLLGAPGDWAASQGRTYYLRGLDGGPAVRLGAAAAYRLFPDGHRILAVSRVHPLTFQVVPVGPGTSREVAVKDLEFLDGPYVLPDGRHAVIGGYLPTKPGRYYLIDLETGSYKPVTPEGTNTFLGCQALSPDGRYLAVNIKTGRPLDIHLIVCPVDGGDPSPAIPLEAEEIPFGWSADGKGILLFNRDGFPTRIRRLDLATGKRSLVREIMPANPAGLPGIREIVVSPDDRILAYNYVRRLSDLYLVEGLR